MNKISSDPAQAQLLLDRGGGGGSGKERLGQLPRLPLKEPMPLHALFID